MSRGRRTWVLVALVVVLGVVAVGGWRWWSDDDQVRDRFASSVEDLPGVADTSQEDIRPDQVRVRMERDATVRQVLAVTERAMDDGCCGLELRLGSAQLFVDSASAINSYDTRAELLTRLGQVEFDGVVRLPTIGLDTLSMDPRDQGDAQETFRAAAGLLRALDQASDKTRFTVDTLLASLGRDSSALLVMTAAEPGARRSAETLLDVAARTEQVDGVEVLYGGAQMTVSTSVQDLDEVGASWQRLAAAVRPVRGASLRVRVGNDDDRLTITGPATDSPVRALQAVATARRAGGTTTYVRTDLSALGADVRDPSGAGRLAKALQPLVPADSRLDATWGPLADQAAGNQIGDRVDVVADLAPRLAVLAKQGYAVGWELNGKYRRLVARPLKPHPGRLRRDPAALRREIARIRSLHWPGAARIDLQMGTSEGSGSCGSASRLVSFRSTADGPGRDFERYGCTDDEDVDAARRAWNAGR